LLLLSSFLFPLSNTNLLLFNFSVVDRVAGLLWGVIMLNTDLHYSHLPTKINSSNFYKQMQATIPPDSDFSFKEADVVGLYNSIKVQDIREMAVKRYKGWLKFKKVETSFAIFRQSKYIPIFCVIEEGKLRAFTSVDCSKAVSFLPSELQLSPEFVITGTYSADENTPLTLTPPGKNSDMIFSVPNETYTDWMSALHYNCFRVKFPSLPPRPRACEGKRISVDE
jgi:hypothetical protein